MGKIGSQKDDLTVGKSPNKIRSQAEDDNLTIVLTVFNADNYSEPIVPATPVN